MQEEGIDKSNIRFYKAFESLSLERMEEVWKHGDDVVCVHPGWDLFTGWSQYVRVGRQYFERLNEFNSILRIQG